MPPTLHFKSDATKCPVIDLEPIKRILSGRKLRRRIRPCTNTFPTIFSAIDTGLTGVQDHADAKICDLNVSVKVNENVLGFDIAVDDSNAMESCDTNGLQ